MYTGRIAAQLLSSAHIGADKRVKMMVGETVKRVSVMLKVHTRAGSSRDIESCRRDVYGDV